MIYNINENISSVVYHFCTIDELIALFYYDEILLSVTQRNSTDFNISKGFDYYYSFTRHRSNKIGYAYKQLHKGVDMYVRITFDGDIFNCSYKGHAVDYFYMMDSDNKFGDEIYSLYGNDCIVKKISTESEDRLFSNRPIIYNASKYIKRVDILIKNIISEDDIFNKLKYLFSHKNHNKVFVFFDEDNYNAYSPEKMIDDNNIVKMFDDYKRASGIINVNYSTQQYHVVACIIKCILYGETYNNDILQKLLTEYEFNDKITNQIINEHNKISDVYNILVNFRKYLRNTKLLFNGVYHKVGLLSFSILLDYLHKKQISLEEFIYQKKLLILCKK